MATSTNSRIVKSIGMTLFNHRVNSYHLDIGVCRSILASCSEDGSLRLWGPPDRAASSSKEEETKPGRNPSPSSPTDVSTIEKFMGLR